jgi:hypothetical protein
MADRFCTMLDCVDTGFIPDGTLDELPLPGQRVLGLGSADGDEVANADISGTRVEHEATESVG